MVRNLSRKEKILFFLLLFLVLAFAVGSYFFFIQPKKEELANKEQELETEQQLLATIESRLANIDSTMYTSTVQLQKEVPVKPLVEKLLLDIEKAEIVSESFVAAISIGEGTELTPEEMEGNNEEEAAEGENAEGEDGSEEEQEDGSSEEKGEREEAETDAPEEVTIPLPEGVEKITVELEVQSDNYFQFEKFIETLENNERITLIENITIEGQEEITSEEQEDEPLTYTVSLSIFYMPGLTDLIAEVPEIDAPEPSKKKNPFSTFPLDEEEKE